MSNTSFRITRKGQVTLPKAIREHLGVSEGEAVRFEIDADGDVVVKAESPAQAQLSREDILKRITQANAKAAPHIDMQGMSADQWIKFLRDPD
jgi:AbrB family looped-hinge helix DNA binding protein